MLIHYADKLNREYADIIDYIHQNISQGDIISIDKYIRGKVNGSFTDIIQEFLVDYEDHEKHIN